MPNAKKSSKNVTFVAYITLRNGKRLYARQYGKRAFLIVTLPILP